MNDNTQPCLKRIDADCFRAHPAWAKQAIAYRLVHLLTPKALTKRLPKGLRTALLAPGVEIPPGVEVPGGIVVAPGTQIPAGWQPGDPVPPGITIPPGTVFPPGWTPGDPIPEGVTLDPGATFPPGWTPGDPLPPGAIPPATAPPGVEESGATPPTYTEPWSPGPVATVSPGVVAPVTVEIIATVYDGTVTYTAATWAATQGAATGDYSSWGDQYITYGIEAADDSEFNVFTIWRSLFPFDLSSIASGKTAKSATLRIRAHAVASSSVCLQEGTQGQPINNPDYDAFEPDLLADVVSWTANAYNTFTFNAAGLTYLSGAFGSTAKLCLREYEHDYLDVAPTGGAFYDNSLYYSNPFVTEAYRPLLTITY